MFNNVSMDSKNSPILDISILNLIFVGTFEISKFIILSTSLKKQNDKNRILYAKLVFEKIDFIFLV